VELRKQKVYKTVFDMACADLLLLDVRRKSRDAGVRCYEQGSKTAVEVPFFDEKSPKSPLEVPKSVTNLIKSEPDLTFSVTDLIKSEADLTRSTTDISDKMAQNARARSSPPAGERVR